MNANLIWVLSVFSLIANLVVGFHRLRCHNFPRHDIWDPCLSSRVVDQRRCRTTDVDALHAPSVYFAPPLPHRIDSRTQAFLKSPAKAPPLLSYTKDSSFPPPSLAETPPMGKHRGGRLRLSHVPKGCLRKGGGEGGATKLKSSISEVFLFRTIKDFPPQPWNVFLHPSLRLILQGVRERPLFVHLGSDRAAPSPRHS